MTIVDYTKNKVALLLGGSSTNYPTHFMIGSGSGATTSSMVTLIQPTDRQVMTSTSFPTLYKIKYIGDWNSTEISGLNLREYGTCVSGTTVTGSIWSRTSVPTINFNGLNELRVEETWEVY